MRGKRKPYSLRVKLILVTTIATAVALFVCAGSLAVYDRWNFSQQLNYELGTDGKVLGANCAAALEFGDKSHAAEVIRAVSANHRIEIVVVYDKAGKEFVRYTRPEAVHKFPSGFSSDNILSAATFSSTSPITHNGDVLGSILLEGGEGELSTRTRTYFLVAGLLMLIAVAVAVGVASVLQKRIFDPIAQLVMGMAEITQRKDYSLRIDGRGEDEVGRLVGTFNKMLSEIQERDNELELRVEERTTALESEVAARKSLQETQEALHEALNLANAANEAKSLFLAKMSHEIRTPMNGVLGMTEILLSTHLDERQMQCAETIEMCARNLLDIINDVLDLSKAEAGKLKLQIEPFEIEGLIGEVGAILQPGAAHKHLDLLCWCAPDVPSRVEGDPGRLRQILLNLAGNAVKFTEQGSVSLEVRVDKTLDTTARVQFEVRDTGVGISLEQQALIFQSFMQVDGNRNRRQGGTGLGLTISKQLVELMGGTLTVTSNPGMGSSFVFQIDLDVDEQASPKAELAGKKLLLATENKDLSRQLIETLGYHGVDTTLAVNHESAILEAEKPSIFDFVVVDSALPNESALEVARRALQFQGPKSAVFFLGDSVGNLSLPSGTAFESTKLIGRPILAGKLIDMMLSAANQGPKHALRPVGTPFKNRKPHLLLVEDNEVNAMVASHFLNTIGCTFRVASDGLEAVEAVNQEHFDLVLMDVQLPRLDGLEATHRIRSSDNPITNSVVIIAMTANALSSERDACIEAGMNDYLSKPMSQHDLSNMLTKWLGEG